MVLRMGGSISGGDGYASLTDGISWIGFGRPPYGWNCYAEKGLLQMGNGRSMIVPTVGADVLHKKTDIEDRLRDIGHAYQAPSPTIIPHS